jgi:hypothetical protein
MCGVLDRGEHLTVLSQNRPIKLCAKKAANDENAQNCAVTEKLGLEFHLKLSSHA